MAYLALLLYTALIFVRPQEWVSWMYAWPIEAVLIVVALVTWAGSVAQGDWKPGKAPQDWLMLGLFFGVLMSGASHLNFGNYAGGVVGSFVDFGKTVLLYFLIVSLLNSAKRAKFFLFVVVCGCLFLTAQIMLEMWTATHTGFGLQTALVQMEDSGAETLRPRAYGIFSDPNDLALMLVAIVPFVLGTVLRRNVFALKRALAAAVAGAMLVGVYLTNSRGGWLALGVMGLAFLLLHFGKKTAIALAVVAFAALVMLGPSRMGLMSSGEDSARERLISWGEGNGMLKSWPLFGVGKGLYIDNSDTGLVAHNSFVQCYAELGLFGYFFWLGLAFASLKDAYAVSKLNPETPEGQEYAAMGKAALVSLTGFLAAAFFLSRTYVIPLFILFAFIAALRRLAAGGQGNLEGAFARKDCKYVLLAEVASIPAIYVFVRAMTLRG